MGITAASAIAYLAGTPRPGVKFPRVNVVLTCRNVLQMSTKLADAGTVVTTNIIEKLLYKEQRKDGKCLRGQPLLIQSFAVFAIYEWLDGQNTRLVAEFPQSLLPVGRILKDSEVTRPALKPTSCCKGPEFLWQQSAPPDAIESMLTSVRFAAGESICIFNLQTGATGRVLSVPTFGALCAQAYFAPGVMEVERAQPTLHFLTRSVGI